MGRTPSKARFGSGRKKSAAVPAQDWEAQYRAGAWKYLDSEAEAGHYLAICELYQRYLPRGSILDIGCGSGTLYRYLAERTGLPPSRYTGIDLAQEAVRQAAGRFPDARFAQCDYSVDAPELRADCVIFNEILYYFDEPLAILNKSLRQNLASGGLLIVSMYGEHHAPLWQAIAGGAALMDERVLENSQQQRWTVRAFKPLP